MTPLQDLARRFAQTDADADLVGARIFDALSAHCAGADTAEGRSIGASLQGWEDGVTAAVVQRVATVRMTELDDIHMESCTTPGAVVVPTAVTLATELGLDRAGVIKAVAVGYEAMTRLGTAVNGAKAVYRGLWPTYFCAPFAAAAVAASLLELDPPRVIHALGLALTRATGLTSSVVGSPLARWLTLGDGARAGCTAAFAARDGFRADVDLARLASVAGIEIDAAALLADAPPAITQVSVKPFPTAKQCLAAVEAATRLRGRGGRGPVHVYVPEAYAGMIAGPPRSDSRLSRVSSARWNVALALLCPEELHDIERLRTVDDPELAPLVAGVEVIADPELSHLYPKQWPARVEISGVSETVIDTVGDPRCGNGLAAVEVKWRSRQQPVEELRDAALAVDASRLDLLLAQSVNLLEERTGAMTKSSVTVPTPTT